MKRILITFFIFINLICQSQVKKIVTKEYRLKKNILGIKLHECESKEFSVYDIKGNEIEFGVYEEDCELDDVETIIDKKFNLNHEYIRDAKRIHYVNNYMYNDKNKIIKSEFWIFRYNKKIFLSEYRVYLYNSIDSLEKVLIYDYDNKINYKLNYIYDNYGNMIESNDSSYITKDSLRYHPLSRKTAFTFDSFGRKIKEIIYSKYYPRIIYIFFDTLNRITEELGYSDSIFNYKITYKYGMSSNLIKESHYYKNDTIPYRNIVNRYDTIMNNSKANVKITESFDLYENTFNRKNEYIYNKKCDLIKIIHYDSGIYTGYTKYEYEYY